MKTVFKYLIIAVVANIIMSCNQEHAVTNELSKAEFLIGNWQSISPEGFAFEEWKRGDGSSLSGKGCFVVGNDTVFSETISLEQNDKQLFYIVTVKGENNDQPVKFVLTSSTNNLLVFENPKHDFPQKISYTKITNDSVIAEISAITDGKLNAQKIPLVRIK